MRYKHWSAARTGKCGRRTWARPAGRPLPNSRLRWSCAIGAEDREFPPASVMRLVCVTGPGPLQQRANPTDHAALPPASVRCVTWFVHLAKFSSCLKRHTGRPHGRESAACGRGLGLRAVRSRIPAYAGHARLGPRTANSLLRRSCADVKGALFYLLISRAE